ncbi:protein phosphatase 2C domain-containing protein [Streptomyces chryseus]
MSQQGERRATSEDEWWNRLYDDEPVPEPAPARGADSDKRDDTADTADTADAGDTLDARFESAAVASAPAPAVPFSPAERDGPPGPQAPAAPPQVDDRAAPPARSVPPEPPGSGPGPADAPPWWVTHRPATAPKPPRHAPRPRSDPRAGAADARPTSPSGPPPAPPSPRPFAPPRPPSAAAPPPVQASPGAAPEPPSRAPLPRPASAAPAPSAPASPATAPEPPPAPVPPPAPPVRPTAEAPHRAPWEAPDMSHVPPPRDESDAASPAARRPKLPRAPWRGARSTGSVPAQPSHTPPAPTGGTADGDSGGDEGPGGRPAPRVGFVGDRPPTYDAEPTALPAADPHELGALVADTVLDGARYGTYTLRAASVRGDSARYRGEPRRDSLLTARFGRGEDALVLVAVAGGARAAGSAHLAAADACRWIGEAVGRSHARLADDIRAGRRGDLKSGLHRLTDRGYGRLRARASELGLDPEEYTVSLRCLLLPADPRCRTRVFFGIGGGGLFRLRGGVWQDIEPAVPEPAAVTGAPVVGFGSPPAGGLGSVPSETPEGDRLTMDLGIPTPPSPYVASAPPPAEPFRFRASVARPGDTLLLCGGGLADPLRGEPALAEELAGRWAGAEPPGLAEYLADTCLRVKGYADDRTAVAVWEA